MEKKQLTQFTFFDLYAELMDTLMDEERGKMLRAMCEFMFKDDVQTELKDKKLIFLWGNFIDYLIVDKTAQEGGRMPKGLNSRMKHFTFHRNFYEAVELMDNKQSGQYVKAIYNYALNGQELSKLSSPVDMYFKLAKRKLELSKIRSNVGRKGGQTERIKLTDELINERTDTEYGMTFGKFMRLHPNVENDLYASHQDMLKGVDWGLLDIGLDRHPEYKTCNSLYRLLVHYKDIVKGV